MILYLIARNWTIDFRMRMLPIVVLLGCIFMLTLLRPMGDDAASTAVRFANFIGGLLLLDLYLRAGVDALRRDADDDGSLHYQLARAYQATGEADKARVAMNQYQEILKKTRQDTDQVQREAPIGPPQ